jgi:hypothetical protein
MNTIYKVTLKEEKDSIKCYTENFELAMLKVKNFLWYKEGARKAFIEMMDDEQKKEKELAINVKDTFNIVFKTDNEHYFCIYYMPYIFDKCDYPFLGIYKEYVYKAEDGKYSQRETCFTWNEPNGLLLKRFNDKWKKYSQEQLILTHKAHKELMQDIKELKSLFRHLEIKNMGNNFFTMKEITKLLVGEEE